MIGQHIFANVMLNHQEENRRPLLKCCKDEDNYRAELLNIFHWVNYILVEKHRAKAQGNVVLEMLFRGRIVTIIGIKKKSDPIHFYDISSSWWVPSQIWDVNYAFMWHINVHAYIQKIFNKWLYSSSL